MSTTINPPIVYEGARLASQDDFLETFSMFVQMLASLILRQSADAGFERWAGIGMRAAEVFNEQLRRATPIIPEDPAGRESVSVLFEEMQFFIWRYQSAALPDTPLAAYALNLQSIWGSQAAQVDTKGAIDDAETIVGSIDKILSWLPAPLRWLLEGILEALKITHGG